jgi:hypothetical protein
LGLAAAILEEKEFLGATNETCPLFVHGAPFAHLQKL